ncbi:hypothetical protein XH88_10755 [Bradyrhizobium sp. CCBAU 51627]|nr:hypothetical protein [Bradyrhizobium sp. CCBAU 51627]
MREHFFFAPLCRKYESMLEEAARRRRACGGLRFDSQLVRMQLKHSVPLAMACGSFALRAQAGQWAVAANFPGAAVELISIASAVMAVGTLTGQPLGNAFLSDIRSPVGEGNVDGARKLISDARVVANAEHLPKCVNPRFM